MKEKWFLFRILLSCSLLPPGKIYIFQNGEEAGRIVEYIKENCGDVFVEPGKEEVEIPEEEIQNMRMLFRSGKEAFEEVDFEKAIKEMEKGVSLLQKNLLFMKDFRDVFTSLSILGICYLALGKKEKAKESFSLLLSMRPDYKPSESLFPPAALEVFQEVKKSMKTHEFSLTTFPEGATVFIDGRKRGITPFVEKKMPEGRHLIAVTMEGYKEFREVISLSKDENLSLVLEKSEVFVPEGWWEKEPEEILSLCRRRCPLPSLFLISKKEEEVELKSAYYSTDREVFYNGKFKPEDYQSSITSIISYIFTTQKIEESKNVGVEVRDLKKETLNVEREPSGSRFLLWTGLGILAGAGLGLGIYFGTREKEKEVRFTINW